MNTWLTMGLSLCIAYASFCRLLRMDRQTRWEVRWSYAMLGTAAMAMAIAPLVPEWGFRPHPLVPFMLAAHVMVLTSMSEVWLKGTPRVLRKLRPAGSGLARRSPKSHR